MKEKFLTENSEHDAQESESAIASERETAWKKTRAEVDAIVDRLGLGIDENIKEAVAIFRVYGFPTSQSCEGHADDEGKHDASFPWVEIYADEPDGWKSAEGERKKEIEREWLMKNLEQQQKLMELLAKFYQERDVPFDAKLAFDRIGKFGGFRVQSFGANMMPLLPPEEQFKKLKLYRKEMDEFAYFLKDKFFKNSL